jgi:uncharacterized integral membrane protein
MAYEYKRLRPSIIRNFWVYRRLIGTAVLLGLMLWFIWANNDPVTVAFPFGVAKIASSTGVVILVSFLAGSLATALAFSVFFAIRKIRTSQNSHDPPNHHDLASDRPPSDYAAKTSEGFPNAHWSN